ncbi:proline--tRNA ligase [Paenibacillus sp. 1011MAR3C5]|uniref:proline--tRNA ligase n=1 Tax=Paenibacillus sp. 1011MAR3C5 TaxID=1675787 RepID=UPI000E6CF4D4|nr:proline--tRNA ligase [Paenibacillus sp. 1011MAR3C5]RJE86935.1 proline--tRNA ligase [Paenibacillus sp. 1011MAR3C5]
MRQSRLLSTTGREAPADAEAVSHQLLLRAGMIRQLAAGIYTYLPLGRRVLRKVEQVIREEMDRTGAQELLMPAMQPAELWKESGRYSQYGPELIRLQDRHNRDFALGPTHEEVITTLVRSEINSYRRLPLTLYQIQTKYRDERRPRYGLLRGREFLMKDAYSFDMDADGLDRSYWQMFEAYNRIFNRCGIRFRAVEADAGTIGGEGGTHEFMALADIGEDTIAACSHCDYAANLEKAESGPQREKSVADSVDAQALEKVHTPGIRTIDELAAFMQIRPEEIIKTLVIKADDQLVAVVVRGDHEINELKVKHYLKATDVTLADSEEISLASGVPVGFLGPVGQSLPLLIDRAVVGMETAVAGANEADYHYRHVNPLRDLANDRMGDFRNVKEGEPCPRCKQGTLMFHRGIEIGHVFKLGTKYSEKLDARFLNSSGQDQPFIMGCYGIGVSRILSAVIEQQHDEWGIVWPVSIAPYHVHLIPISIKNDRHMEVAQQLYDHLLSQGIEVLLDDRDERPGVKFKDADLIGIPVRIVIGKDAEQGMVEYTERRTLRKELLRIGEALERARNAVSLDHISEV